jgi:hypothetical protein
LGHHGHDLLVSERLHRVEDGVTVDNGEAVVDEDGRDLPEAPDQCFELTPLVLSVDPRVLRVWLHSADRQGEDFRDISHHVHTQGRGGLETVMASTITGSSEASADQPGTAKPLNLATRLSVEPHRAGRQGPPITC